MRGLAAVAATLGGGTASMAAFPAATTWTSRIGRLNVPFVLDGTPADAIAFSKAAREAAHAIATRDVPSVLRDASREALAIYLERSRSIGEAILRARPGDPSIAPSSLDVVLPAGPRRTAYVTIAASAALVRWRYAAIGGVMEPVARGRQRRPIKLVLRPEIAGLDLADALLSRAGNDVSGQGVATIEPWQLELISRAMAASFAPLAGTAVQDQARQLALAYGYGESLTRGPSVRPDDAERAATLYATALLEAAVRPIAASARTA